jgi:hypothetical protein
MFLRNIGTPVLKYTSSHPRRPSLMMMMMIIVRNLLKEYEVQRQHIESVVFKMLMQVKCRHHFFIILCTTGTHTVANKCVVFFCCTL